MKLQITIAALLAFALSAAAQDPPSRVARLSLLEGPVSFQPESVNEWSGATLNYPLTTGDHLYTDQGARSELRMGPNAIRLSGQTNFGFLNLDDQTVQIRLTEGSLIVRVRGLGDQDVWEVDTPNGAISLLRAGDYRIDTDPNRNATMVTVRGGEAEVTANGQSFPVHPRQTAYFSGDGRQESVQAANPPDDFDNFSFNRDRLEDAAPAPRYVSRQMVGYEDLDRYGSWDAGDQDGPVWRPRVRADWAPYHDGHWAWRDPWGWTWIDDAPWGFAPFHYGRWAYARGGWGWYPGPVVARPVYAPALVAFVGGGGFGLSIGIGGGGGVGWFPLGPREEYRPAYHVSQRYERELNGREYNNITINRNVTNVYINRNAPGAFTAVSRQDFVSARPVQGSAFRGSPDQFRTAQVSGFSAGVAPQRESLFGRQQGGPVARPRDAVFNREVIARTPPPAAPVSFEARQQALRANQGRPLAPQQIDQLRGQQNNMSQPAVRSAISPNQGFGRNTGSGTPTPTPNQPTGNQGFGRNGQQPAPQGLPRTNVAPQDNNRGFGQNGQQSPQAVPQSAPQPVPQQDTGRGNGRFDSRPPQATPRTDVAPQDNNRGFGRNGQQPQQGAPQSAPQPVPQQDTGRGNGRFDSRPPQATPRTDVAPQDNNRGFGRNGQQPQQAVPQAAPPVARPQQPVAAPAPENQQPNRGFGRAGRPDFNAPPQSAPPPSAPVRQQVQPEARPVAPPAPRNDKPAENRGFGRNSRPQEQQAAPPPQAAPRNEPAPKAEPRPAENRGFGRDARPEPEKPKEEKPKQ